MYANAAGRRLATGAACVLLGGSLEYAQTGGRSAFARCARCAPDEKDEKNEPPNEEEDEEEGLERYLGYSAALARLKLVMLRAKTALGHAARTGVQRRRRRPRRGNSSKRRKSGQGRGRRFCARRRGARGAAARARPKRRPAPGRWRERRRGEGRRRRRGALRGLLVGRRRVDAARSATVDGQRDVRCGYWICFV